MKKQNFELKNEKIKTVFAELKKNHPERLSRRLNPCKPDQKQLNQMVLQTAAYFRERENEILA